MASGHWWWWPQPGQTDHTYLHKFALNDPMDARYVASGGVEGHIVDQFSMDENADGFFRVATTIASRVPDLANPQNIWGTLQTTNRISVLGERAGQLTVVGRSEEISAGESITSARFIGNKVKPTPVSDKEMQRVLKQLGKEERLEVTFERTPIRDGWVPSHGDMVGILDSGLPAGLAVIRLFALKEHPYPSSAKKNVM